MCSEPSEPLFPIGNTVLSLPLMKYNLRPHGGVEFVYDAKLFDPNAALEDARSQKGYAQAFEQVQEAIREQTLRLPPANAYPEVVFLGKLCRDVFVVGGFGGLK